MNFSGTLAVGGGDEINKVDVQELTQ